MKKILLFIFALMTMTSYSQIHVKEGSFRKIDGYVMLDKASHVDDNEAEMALIKISTENITAEERARFEFKGNAITYFDAHFMTGEIHLYVSPVATFIEIIHPDFGKTEYWLPEDLCGYCGYEMVVVSDFNRPNDPVKPQTTYLVISCDQPDALIYIDDVFVGNGKVNKSFKIGSKHTWKIECDSYHTESGSITLNKKEVIDMPLRPAFGTLEVKTTPESGASVFIDNKYQGVTPCKIEKLKSGTYTLKVVKEMYKTSERTIVIKDNETTPADVEMTANFSNITITTDSQSEIYVDEQFVGKGKWSGRLSQGTHFVEAKKLNHKTSSKNINVVLGKNESIAINDPEPIMGHLDIDSSPMDAEIYIDGKHYGTTPNVIADLLIGNHELRLEKQGCAPLYKTIVIKEGETLSLNETMTTGREVVVRTSCNTDNVYIDNKYVGKSPVTTNLSYGTHVVKVQRDGKTVTKNIEVGVGSSKINVEMAFGKLLAITSSAKGDKVYVDNKYVGETPLEVDLSLETHEVEVRRGKLYDQKRIYVHDTRETSFYFNPHKESLSKYLKNGVNFITLNWAYTSSPQHSFGITFGSLKGAGWFASLMSGLDFRGLAAGKTEEVVELTGESASSRLSVIGGLIFKMGGPVCGKIGAGFGMRTKCWEATDGNWYKNSVNSTAGIDLTAGLQLNLKHATFSVDMVTLNFRTIELKLGIGVNWKK